LRSSAVPGPSWRGSGPAGRPAAQAPAPPAESRHLARLIELVEQAVGDLAAVERHLAELATTESTTAAAPEVRWLEDDELAGRLQGILARQARQRGIDLS
jgi:hypothetical protein